MVTVRATFQMMLLSGVALPAAAWAQQAAAQPAGGAQAARPAATASSVTGLGEIVVTATRQASSINRVPLSITAATQQTLDRQGLKQVDDLVRLAPALTIRRGLDSSSNIAIRGIISTGGSQTTGVYLDDTPLQKRSAIGSVNGNGSPTPPLFDLERVEVLRGPQGTLFGGSSLGGTVRFITPTPSLTEYSTYARSEVSTTQGGTPSGELGVAFGGPVVQDKLGIRFSIYGNHAGGYIDHRNIYTGEKLQQNTNSQDSYSARLSVLWQVTDKLRIEPQLFGSYQKINDADFYFQDIPEYTVGPVFTSNTGSSHPPYTYPAHTYGPISAGPFTSFLLNNYQRQNKLLLPDLNVEYDLGGPTLKAITSYIDERVNGSKEGGFDNPGNQLGGTGLVSELPDHTQTYGYIDNRHGWIQELRLSSPANQKPFSYVFGVYYQNLHTYSDYQIRENLDEIARVIHGSNIVDFYHADYLPNGAAGERQQTFDEKEISAFGEVNWWLTDKLKATGGVRVASNEFRFRGTYIGPLVGSDVVSLATGTLTEGKVKEHPVTPKGSVSYQITPNDLVYVSAAKGYREGGVNTTAQTAGCSAALAAYGGDPPIVYKSDSIWSYEAGAKVRALNGKLQVNSSAFYIDWKNIQTSVPLPGCFTFVQNAAQAVSKGFDLQAQVQPIHGLLLNASVGYTHARFTKTLLGPANPANGTQALIINKGDQLPVSPWTVQVGGEYDFALGPTQSYFRADYTYNSAYHRTYGPGTNTYDPDLYTGNSTQIVNARVGARFDRFDLSAFVNNLFNSRDVLDKANGRQGCLNAACTAYTYNNRLIVDYTFRPRTIGLTLSYRD